MYRISLADLAGNAFIEALKKNSNCVFLSYENIEEYGEQAVQILSEKGLAAVLDLSREKTSEFLREYSGVFFEESKNGIKGLALHSEVTSEYLIRKFRGYLAVDVLLALADEKVIGVLKIYHD